MDGAADRQLGARLGALVRRDPTLTAQQLQALVQDLLGDDLSLRAPLRELILLPTFRQLSQETSPAQAAAQRDALLAELAGTFHPSVLQRLSVLLDGMPEFSADNQLPSARPPATTSPAPSLDSSSPLSAESAESTASRFSAGSIGAAAAADPAPEPAALLLPPLPRTSARMQKRLQQIHTLVMQGYGVEKRLGAFPVVLARNGRHLPPRFTGQGSTGGFSWIGFFFPFVICFQIKEWSFFAVTFIVSVLLAIPVGVAANISPNVAAALSILGLIVWMAVYIYYGLAIARLRYLHAMSGQTPSRLLPSVILGTLAVIACDATGEFSGGFIGGFIYGLAGAFLNGFT